jgi:UDP-N-acetylglucosamine 2-epimerase (non-hydrolysing)
MTPKILIAIGTRPEAIKLAPIIKALEASNIFEVSVCVTGQHSTMVEQPLELFGITSHHNLHLMKPAQTLASLSIAILDAMMPILAQEKPGMIIVQGDTTTAFICALAAFYHQGVKIIHVEAGLRTFDKQAPFPEEINRQLIGRLADIHCAPTEQAKEHLLNEAVPEKRIVVTGNTAIDALHIILKEIRATPKEILWKRLALPPALLERLENNQESPQKKLLLVTGHRRENFGDGFEQICSALLELSQMDDVEIIYPVHLNPNVQKPVYSLLSNRENIHLLEPLDYLSFAYLLDKCYLVITDSGGIQEEAPSLGKPVLVMRDVTERQEAVEAGTSILVGTNRERIVKTARNLMDDQALYQRIAKIHNPFGDGSASQKIVQHLAHISDMAL